MSSNVQAVQSRSMSFLESCTNTAIGFVVSFCAWPFVALAFDYPYSLGHNLAITGIFTALSVARGYVIRRWFNGGHWFDSKGQ